LHAAREIELAIRFTEAYRRHLEAPPAQREAACLAVQYPGILPDIRPGDLFAGRERKLLDYIVMFSPQQSGDGGGQAGYCLNSAYLKQMAEAAGPAYAQAARDLAEFWQQHSSNTQARAQWDNTLRNFCGRGMKVQPGSGTLMGYGGNMRLAGMVLDYDTLLHLGLPGIRRRLSEAAGAATGDGSRTALFEGMRQALEVLDLSVRHYREQAVSMAREAESGDPARAAELRQMAEILEALRHRAPRSLREAIQLMWLYSVLACVRNYGRMDVYLGDFYACDIDSCRLSEDEAQRLLASLWRLIDGEGDHPWDTRIMLGGQGRRNQANADRFALAAMEVTRRYRKICPCLTLRFHRGQDKALMAKALDVIGEGCLYPMLYNDDINVAAVSRELEIPAQDALNYFPLGCGEYILEHMGIASPNTVFNVGKCVEAALHRGRCAISQHLIGADAGPLDSFDTFEKLYDAVKQQIRVLAPQLARTHAIEAHVHQRQSAFLLISLLTDDCLARDKSLVDGGVRYSGACVEGFGFTNAGDSLAAIRRVVYEQKSMTLEHLVAALDANFEGFAKERALLLAVPKYGNDDEATDCLVVDFSSFIAEEIMRAGKEAGLHHLVVSNVNPGGLWAGAQCAASADGRRRGEPFAIGNSPTAGRDVCGITALLNSIARSNPENGGAITNLKFSKEFFTRQRAKLESLLDTYWSRGGFQANITVVGRDDLENAMKEPEKYAHVMVRLGGWSARFIDLEKRTQLEVLARTLY
jgi:pyruvate-formate lyase